MHRSVFVLLFLCSTISLSFIHRDARCNIGTNIGWLQSFNPQFMFKDAMLASRVWIVQNASGYSWTDNTALYTPPLDVNGYPLYIPFDPDGTGPVAPQKVTTILLGSLSRP